MLVSLLLAGLVTGFSKFSVGGMGLLILPIVMISFPGPEALGVIVPLYVATDLMAISLYRKHISWIVLARFIPLGAAGILLGGWLLASINTQVFNYLLSLVILCILALGIYLDNKPENIMQHPLAVYFTGLLAGFISLIANAAGPIFSLFLMEQKLSKEAYISTRAWGFLIINLSKVPVLWSLGLLNWEVTSASLYALPGMLLGALIGYWLLRRLQLTQFKWLIRIMASLGALKLLVF